MQLHTYHSLDFVRKLKMFKITAYIHLYYKIPFLSGIACILVTFSFFLIIGHLHDGIILLLRPEFFWVFFSYLNLVVPVRFK